SHAEQNRNIEAGSPVLYGGPWSGVACEAGGYTGWFYRALQSDGRKAGPERGAMDSRDQARWLSAGRAQGHETGARLYAPRVRLDGQVSGDQDLAAAASGAVSDDRWGGGLLRQGWP